MAGGLKEVRERIASVQNTMQITSAMKMVSAAKLRRAQDAITRMRPYAEKLQGVLANVSATLDSAEGVYSVQRPVRKLLVVAVTSNRGLCGGFNNNILKATRAFAAKHPDVQVEVLPLGKKAHDAYKRRDEEVAAGFATDAWRVFDALDFNRARSIADAILQRYAAGEYDKVVVIYNRFVNAAVQELTVEDFLPLLPLEGAGTGCDYLFEPSKEDIVERVVPNSLRVQFYKALLDSHASEHGARMTAMHQATDNASELIRDLKISYNKARQTAITTEILEIVAGSEALDG
jgi:F-type H+-transporting ATPase subunit gamma